MNSLGIYLISKKGKKQIVTNQINTSRLNQGYYHAIVRLDNTEPISKRPMSAFYYDVEIEVK